MTSRKQVRPIRAMLRATVPVVALLLLGGCVETRFESPLGDNIESCDVRWKGLWIAAEDIKDDNSTSEFQVDEECRFMVFDQPERGGPLKSIHVPINFVHDRGVDYLVVSDAQLKPIFDVDAPFGIDPKPEKSFYFARYKVRGDRIELRQVDSQKTARLVLDEKLDGTVSKTRSELHVYVRGNRAQMLELVRKQAIFVDKPSVFVRSKQSVTDFEKSLIQKQRGQRP